MSGSGTYVPPAGGRSSSSGGGASTVRGLRVAGSSGGGAAASASALSAAAAAGSSSSASGGAAAANLFKTKHNPFLKTFNTSSPLSNAHSISNGQELIEDFDNKIKLVYDDFSKKSLDLTAIIEMFIQDLKEGKKTIKDLSEGVKKEIKQANALVDAAITAKVSDD